MTPWGRFGLSMLSLAVLTVGGTGGYMLIEDWSLPRALYMTVITLSTVGFGEVAPLSPEGQWLSLPGTAPVRPRCMAPAYTILQ